MECGGAGRGATASGRVHVCRGAEVRRRRGGHRDEEREEEERPGSSGGASSAGPQAERLESLQQANRILFRTIHVLSERSKRAAGREAEYEAWKAELTQCQEQKRKLEHANQMLQWRLRVNLDESSGRAQSSGGSVAGF